MGGLDADYDGIKAPFLEPLFCVFILCLVSAGLAGYEGRSR